MALPSNGSAPTAQWPEAVGTDAAGGAGGTPEQGELQEPVAAQHGPQDADLMDAGNGLLDAPVLQALSQLPDFLHFKSEQCLPEPRDDDARPRLKVPRRSLSRSRSGYDITIDDLRPLFNLSRDQAARRLGMGLSSLKRHCAALGIQRWPHRKLASLHALRAHHEQKPLVDPAEQEELMQAIQRDLDAIMLNPDHKLDPLVEARRVTKYKYTYHRNRSGQLHKLGSRHPSSGSLHDESAPEDDSQQFVVVKSEALDEPPAPTAEGLCRLVGDKRTRLQRRQRSMPEPPPAATNSANSTHSGQQMVSQDEPSVGQAGQAQAPSLWERRLGPGRHSLCPWTQQPLPAADLQLPVMHCTWPVAAPALPSAQLLLSPAWDTATGQPEDTPCSGPLLQAAQVARGLSADTLAPAAAGLTDYSQLGQRPPHIKAEPQHPVHTTWCGAAAAAATAGRAAVKQEPAWEPPRCTPLDQPWATLGPRSGPDAGLGLGGAGFLMPSAVQGSREAHAVWEQLEEVPVLQQWALPNTPGEHWHAPCGMGPLQQRMMSQAVAGDSQPAVDAAEIEAFIRGGSPLPQPARAPGILLRRSTCAGPATRSAHAVTPAAVVLSGLVDTVGNSDTGPGSRATDRDPPRSWLHTSLLRPPHSLHSTSLPAQSNLQPPRTQGPSHDTPPVFHASLSSDDLYPGNDYLDGDARAVHGMDWQGPQLSPRDLLDSSRGWQATTQCAGVGTVAASFPGTGMGVDVDDLEWIEVVPYRADL